MLAGHPTTHGGNILMNHYIRLDDLDSRLNPSLKSKHLDKSLNELKANLRFETINSELSIETIRERIKKDRYPEDQVYLDLMPIFVSAVCKVFKACKKAGLDFKGFDAETYEIPFVTELDVDLTSLDFKRLWLRAYGPTDLIPIPA